MLLLAEILQESVIRQKETKYKMTSYRYYLPISHMLCTTEPITTHTARDDLKTYYYSYILR